MHKVVIVRRLSCYFIRVPFFATPTKFANIQTSSCGEPSSRFAVGKSTTDEDQTREQLEPSCGAVSADTRAAPRTAAQ